jgi:hypothetical protein
MAASREALSHGGAGDRGRERAGRWLPAVELAGGLGPMAMVVLRCFPGRRKWLRRHGRKSRSQRWRRLAPGGDDRDESRSAAHRPAAAQRAGKEGAGRRRLERAGARARLKRGCGAGVLGGYDTDAEAWRRRTPASPGGGRREPCPPWTLGELGIWAQMGFRGRARGRAGGLGCWAGADRAAAC